MNLKDMYTAWVSTSKDKKYTADLFNVKLKSGEEVLCRDYSDIPAEDIVLVTKYTNCYIMDTDIIQSARHTLEINYTGGK